MTKATVVLGDGSLAPSPAETPKRTKVWDPVVRLFHWTLVTGIVANLTVFRELKAVHRYVGYVIVAAIALLVFYCLPGTPGPNKYGPDPLGGAAPNLNETFS